MHGTLLLGATILLVLLPVARAACDSRKVAFAGGLGPGGFGADHSNHDAEQAVYCRKLCSHADCGMALPSVVEESSHVLTCGCAETGAVNRAETGRRRRSTSSSSSRRTPSSSGAPSTSAAAQPVDEECGCVDEDGGCCRCSTCDDTSGDGDLSWILGVAAVLVVCGVVGNFMKDDSSSSSSSSSSNSQRLTPTVARATPARVPPPSSNPVYAM